MEVKQQNKKKIDKSVNKHIFIDNIVLRGFLKNFPTGTGGLN